MRREKIWEREKKAMRIQDKAFERMFVQSLLTFRMNQPASQPVFQGPDLTTVGSLATEKANHTIHSEDRKVLYVLYCWLIQHLFLQIEENRSMEDAQKQIQHSDFTSSGIRNRMHFAGEAPLADIPGSSHV